MHKLLTLTTVALALSGAQAYAGSSAIPSPAMSIEELGQSVAAPQRNWEQDAQRAWKRSLIPVMASQALDIASSYGMRELNPALADGSGRFGARAAGMKIGATAAILGVEYLIVRHHPAAARVLSKLNWTGSVVTSGFAVHNYAIR